jgi:hypothetical protein
MSDSSRDNGLFLSDLAIIEVNLDHLTSRFFVIHKYWPPVCREHSSAANSHGPSCKSGWKSYHAKKGIMLREHNIAKSGLID